MANSTNTRHVTDHSRAETTRRALSFLPVVAFTAALASSQAQATPSSELSPALKLIDKIRKIDQVISELEDRFDEESERLWALGLSAEPTVFVRMQFDHVGVLPLIPPVPAKNEREIRRHSNCAKNVQYGSKIKPFGDQVELHVQELLTDLELKKTQFWDAYQRSSAPLIVGEISKIEKQRDEILLELLNCRSRDLADVQAKTRILGMAVLFDEGFEGDRPGALEKLVS